MKCPTLVGVLIAGEAKHVWRQGGIEEISVFLSSLL